MASGITLQLRYLKRPAPQLVHVAIEYDAVGNPVAPGVTYVNSNKDRSLAGKARRRARRAARSAA